jgi:hypothetical protein
MAITKYIQSNQGDVITIPSVHLYTDLPFITTLLPGGYGRGWGYDAGIANSGSVLNLTDLYDEAISKPAVSSATFNSIVRWKTMEEMQTQQFIDLCNTVNDSIAWLWGSFTEGGYGFIHIENGIETVWHQGIVEQVTGDTTEYLYNINHAGASYGGYIQRKHITDCVITCIDNGEIMFPDIVLWTSYKDYQGPNEYFYLEFNVGELSYQWRVEPNDLASVCTGDVATGTWLTTVYPKRPWYIDNEYIRNVSSFTYDKYYMLGGWANREVSEDGDPFKDTTDTGNKGGDGGWNGTSESTPASDVEQIETDAINSGFVTLYKPTKTTIKSFCNWLWTDITDSLATQIKRLLTNPLDGILFIATTHLQPPTTQGTSEIKFCGIGSGVHALTVPKQFSKFDCGYLQYVSVDGSYSEKIIGDTDTFLDYQPYSKAEIYIPSIGYKEVDVNDVIGSKIHLVLSVDWVSGAILAQLEMTRNKRKNGDAELNQNTLYEYQGNIYTNLPISASDWKSFYTNILNVGGGLASALSGNIGQGIGQAVSSIATQQVSVQKSGNVAASYGYMGQQGIYMYLTRPNPAIPVNYKGFKGYSTNQRYKLGELHGYTEIESETLWVDGFDGITESEADLLKEICGSGFYL